MMIRGIRRVAALLCAGFLTACTVGPDYQRPAAITPNAYKATARPAAVDEEFLATGWKVAAPEAVVDANWWTLFNDSRLELLLAQVSVSNQELAQAEARYRQAHALVRSARAELLPDLGTSVNYSRSGTGGGDNTFVGDTTRRSGKRYDLGLDIGWELDLWGRIRRQVEANVATATAEAAEVAAARLSLQSSLAEAYFELRVVDEQRRLLAETVAAFERSVELTENQYRAGLAARSDVVQALTQLEATRADGVELKRRRAELENAIAVLIGKPPVQFELPPQPFALALPTVPVGVPSELLERRPDIAASERRVAAANARIGVAKAAYFPSLTLSASGGYQSGSIDGWLDLPNRYWSVGPAIAATLFDGGARRAETARTIASYDESVAAYRQTVLVAFREVEDALSQLQVLAEAATVRRRAVELAEEAERLVSNQYRAGRVSFLNVATAQTATLDNRRILLDLMAQRLVASVQLIAALGGSWDAPEILGSSWGAAEPKPLVAAERQDVKTGT